MMSNRHLEDSV